jgi:hypothetical protein
MTPVLADGPARQMPPLRYRGGEGLHCSCHPAAFALTASQRDVLDRIRKIADQLEAAGYADKAAALRTQVDGTERELLAKCVHRCGES